MSDAQFAMLASAFATAAGVLAAVVRWSIGRVSASWDRWTDTTTKAIEASTDRTVAALDRNTAAFLASATSATALSTKIDKVSEWVEEHTPVGDERSTPVDTPTARRNTPVRGVYGPVKPR